MKRKLIYMGVILCLLVSLVPAVLAAPAAQAAGLTWYVDDDGAQYPAADFDNIQEAIDVATAGDTIVVYDGFYGESIDIDKSLTVTSANGAGVTIIDGDDDIVVWINASDVTFGGVGQGFTVTNGGGGIVLYTDIDGDISGNTISGNTVHSCEYGIDLYNIGDGTFSGNTISGNTVYDCAVCINLYDVMGITVTGNTVSGNTVYDCEIGIELDAREGGTISGNTISGNTAHHCGAGIELYASMGGTISGNTVSGNTAYSCGGGIVLYAWMEGTVSGNTVSGNTVYDCEVGIELEDDSGDTITENTVSGNTVSDCWRGIDISGCDNISVHDNNILYNDDTGLFILESEDITVTANIIHYNGEGIYLVVMNTSVCGNDIRYNYGAELTGIYVDYAGGDTRINCNNIVGNDAFESWGVYNDGEGTLDATCNWWGASNGPSGFGPGSGDAVSENVSYSDWLTAEFSLNGSMAQYVVNTAAVPGSISLYDMIFYGAPQDLYSLGPAYADIIVEVTEPWTCGVMEATINLSALLLDMLPEDFEETEVSSWGEEGQYYWYEWMEYLGSIPMEFYVLGEGEVFIWDYELWLEELFFDDGFGEEIEDLALNIFFEAEYMDSFMSFFVLLFEDLRLGEFQVPVTIEACWGELTVYVTLAVVDFQFPLGEGWNLRSTPVSLSASWRTWGDICMLGDGMPGFEAAIKWNASTGMWEEVGLGTAFSPLEPYYIKMSERDQIGFIVNRQVTGPPERLLYAGWNLVSVAPDYWYEPDEGEWPFAIPFPAMLVEDALYTVSDSWLIAQCPLEYLEYMETFFYEGFELEKLSYEKFFLQEPWTALSEGEGWGSTPWVTPGGGFWVFMDSADVLAGFSYTPFPWLWLD